VYCSIVYRMIVQCDGALYYIVLCYGVFDYSVLYCIVV